MIYLHRYREPAEVQYWYNLPVMMQHVAPRGGQYQRFTS